MSYLCSRFQQEIIEALCRLASEDVGNLSLKMQGKFSGSRVLRGLFINSAFSRFFLRPSLEEWCSSTTLLLLLPFVVRNGKQKLKRQQDKTATLTMRKILIFCLLFSVGWVCNAQSYTQKYNSTFDRTEYYDSYGTMVGYSKYNKIFDRIEYYDAYGNLKKTESYNSTFDRTETKNSNGNVQSTRNYNSTFDREDIKDKNGNVIGYRKWNSTFERYDVFNSYGTLVGYYKYNSIFDRWEYHEQ